MRNPEVLMNAFGSIAGHIASVVSGRPVVLSLPVSVSLELSRRCNLDCVHCSRRENLTTGTPPGDMDPVLLERVVREIRDKLASVYLYFQGESLLHPGFSDCVRICQGLKRVVSTNGLLLQEKLEILLREPPEILIVSLDDLRGPVAYRQGASGDQILEAIRSLVARRRVAGKRLPVVVVQTLVHKNNENYLYELRRRALEAGADRHVFKSMQITNFSLTDNWVPRKNAFRRYRKTRNGEYRIRKIQTPGCLRAWYHPVITWEGLVLPCCFDKREEFVLGDIGSQTFQEIWFSKKYIAFRRSLLQSPGELSICRNCTSGMLPWIKR